MPAVFARAGCLPGCAAMLVVCGAATGGPVVYTAVDHEAEPGQFSSRPNCDAADLAWTSAASGLGALSLVDFESIDLEDNLTTRPLGGGMTLSGGRFHIRQNTGSAVDGYNTTASGARYASADESATGGSPVIYTFAFDQPIQAFSLYITGVGNRFGGSMALSFSDGQSHTIPLTNLYNLGGAQFVGFTDAGQSVSSISFALGDSPNGINAARLAIDDVRWVHTIPSPGALGMLALAGLGAPRRRR